MQQKYRVPRGDFPRAFCARVSGAHLTLAISKKTTETTKFACVVSKKVASGSFQRNKIKRRCRAIFSTLIPNTAVATYIIFPKKSALHASFADLLAETKAAIAKLQAKTRVN